MLSSIKQQLSANDDSESVEIIKRMIIVFNCECLLKTINCNS